MEQQVLIYIAFREKMLLKLDFHQTKNFKNPYFKDPNMDMDNAGVGGDNGLDNAGSDGSGKGWLITMTIVLVVVKKITLMIMVMVGGSEKVDVDGNGWQ